jgi:hypothetical protein
MSMTSLENELARLYELLDQEVTTYGLIIKELKKQAECLREGDTDRLLEVVHEMGQQTDAAQGLQKAVETLIAKTLPGGNGGVESLDRLAARVSPAHRKRMISYGRTLKDLRARMAGMNERNKIFVCERLNFFSELTSSLVAPGMVSYPNARRSTGPVPSFAFNREV